MSQESVKKKTTLTKKYLIRSVARDQNICPEETRQIIQAFLDKMTESLGKGERIEFRDFGIFEVVERKQKIGRNPKKAEVPIIIPERLVVKFVAGKKMDLAAKHGVGGEK
jgi:integration host factor subunit beta